MGKDSQRPSRLWLWFAAACVLQVLVWGAWIAFASKHRVAEVPLATSSGGGAR
jgi:hypothetical protein